MCDRVVFSPVLVRAPMSTRGIWYCKATAGVVQPYSGTHHLETYFKTCGYTAISKTKFCLTNVVFCFVVLFYNSEERLLSRRLLME